MLGFNVCAEPRSGLNYPSRIEVIFDNSTPIQGLERLQQKHPSIELALYNLNAPDLVEDELGRGLTGNPEKAHQILMARLEQIGRETLEKRFKAAYQGVIKAQFYGIDRFPAVVFDRGASVVYGVSDLEAAVARYQHWREAYQ